MKDSLLIWMKVLVALFPVFVVLSIVMFACGGGFKGVFILLGSILLCVILYIAAKLFCKWVDFVFNNF